MRLFEEASEITGAPDSLDTYEPLKALHRRVFFVHATAVRFPCTTHPTTPRGFSFFARKPVCFLQMRARPRHRPPL